MCVLCVAVFGTENINLNVVFGTRQNKTKKNEIQLDEDTTAKSRSYVSHILQEATVLQSARTHTHTHSSSTMESNKYSLDTEIFSSLLRIIIDYKFFFNQIENEREPQFKFL